MQLVKLITPKKIKTLHIFYLTILVLVFSAFVPVFGQDNSPYSRYGIGDLTPSTNILNRGMGGISAGYADLNTINFNNPASYSSFLSYKEAKSKKITQGRAILDVGVNIDNRTLKEPNNPEKFTASNALFSYVQIGVPLKKNAGLTLGIRPISRISYRIANFERLINPLPPFNPIDSAVTRFEGNGGSYLATMGVGATLLRKEKYNLEQRLSAGINFGYMFGEKDYSTKRSLLNDTVEYYQANFETKTNFGNIYFNAGLQYAIPLKKNLLLTLGAYGNIGQKMNATQDILRETFFFDQSVGELRLDSISDKRDIKGKLELPSSYTFGFVLQKYVDVGAKESGWLIGVDFIQQNWSKYRFYGGTDNVQNKWELRIGGQYNPVPKQRKSLSNVQYRAGFFIGPDYINVGKKLPTVGGSFGLGLPFFGRAAAANQVSIINLAFEYSKRGNNNNVLSENMFRISLGFSLSDMWFGKRKYD
jgi:hypothetical protein